MTAPVHPRIPKIPKAVIQEWRDSGYPYKEIAAALAEWAVDQRKGTVVPADAGFLAEFGVEEVSKNVFQRARVFASYKGVLVSRDEGRSFTVA